jgi:hypothetical protein
VNCVRALAWPERTIRAKRAGTKPQPWTQGRRHAMQRRATICAKLRMHLIRAQPCSARHTFRVDALHGPAGKILHRCLQNFSALVGRTKAPLEKLGGFCGTALVVSRRKPLLVVGMLRNEKRPAKRIFVDSGLTNQISFVRVLIDHPTALTRIMGGRQD